jgi:predicted peptidase
MIHEQRETLSYGGVQLSYFLHTADAAEPLPLVLFLHGAGERGSELDRVRTHGIPRELSEGRELRCVAASPQCPAGRYWTELTGALASLIDELERTHATDPARVYLTGLSMGGYGVWKLASEIPERIAAAVPVCGGGDPRWAPRLASVPIWAFHGSDDPIVPASESLRMVSALEELGAPVELTMYPDVGHDSWTRTFADDALYEWLFAQRRA